MLIKQDVGIVSYGTAIPSRVITTTEIEKAQGKAGSGVGISLGVKSKTVPDRDEDTITLATRAAQRALAGFREDKSSIGNLFIGSESHPYAVKPSGTVVKNILGLSEDMAVADLQFACKAGTQGMQIGFSYILSGLSKNSLIIGSDTAQAEAGDALEFTAGAGAGAYILGQGSIIAKLIATHSICTDTPDFWRRAGQATPQHAGRFSGEPAYFYHVLAAAQKILAETNLKPKDFAHCVFHTPNGKFPKLAAAQLGFSAEQLKASLVVEKIGNTYAAAVPLALAAVLDVARPNQKILVVSYGSGAGSDAFVFETTAEISNYRQRLQAANKASASGITQALTQQISLTTPIEYAEYESTMKLINH